MLETDPSPSAPGPAVIAGQIVQVLASLAGLVGWVILLGSIRLWSRLDASAVPDPAGLAARASREELIAEGMALVVVPLVLAVLAAVACRIAARWWGTRPSFGDLTALRGDALVVAVACGIETLLAVLAARTIGFSAMLVLMAVTVLTVVIEGAALTASSSTVSVVVAIAIVLWGGTYTVVRQYDGRVPHFDQVRVALPDSEEMSGLLVSDATRLTLFCPGTPTQVVALRADDVAQTTIEARQTVSEHVEALARGGGRDCVRASNGRGRSGAPISSSSVSGSATPTPAAGASASAVSTTLGTPALASALGFEARSTARVRLGADWRVVVPLGRFAGRVSGVVTFIARTTAGERRLETRAFQVDAHRLARVELGLSAGTRHVLRQTGHAGLRVDITARAADGTMHRFGLSGMTVVPPRAGAEH